MLAYYTDEEDVPTQKHESGIIDKVPFEVIDDPFSDEETDPNVALTIAVNNALRAFRSGDHDAGRAWSELALKQGFKPDGRYRSKNL